MLFLLKEIIRQNNGGTYIIVYIHIIFFSILDQTPILTLHISIGQYSFLCAFFTQCPGYSQLPLPILLSSGYHSFLSSFLLSPSPPILLPISPIFELLCPPVILSIILHHTEERLGYSWEDSKRRQRNSRTLGLSL